MDTVARFTLLRLNGKRTLNVNPDAPPPPVRLLRRLRGIPSPPTSRSALEWLLDCLFYPETAAHYRCFSVESSEVVVALGVTPHGKKRDRYSYHELRPGLDRLMTLAQEASKTPDEQRAWIDNQLIVLANNILAYEALTRFMAFARVEIPVASSSFLAVPFPDRTSVRTSEIIARVPDYLAALVEMAATMDDTARERVARELNTLFETLDGLATTARLFALIPPEDVAVSEWLTPGDVIEGAFDREYDGETPIQFIAGFEALADLNPGERAFMERLRELHGQITARASSRSDYRHIPLEVSFYRGRYLFLSQWLFAMAFLVIACSWLLPRSGKLSTLMNLSLAPPIVLLVIGITLRCIIRGRPPVTTLYETILFTTLTIAMLGFFVEFVNRRRIAMSIGAILGMLGMFLASRYEAREAVDTMPAVIAVLDTNFWLATHVTTIIAGYGAGLFTYALAHVYIAARLLGVKGSTPRFYDDLGRVIYGTVAFCLVFTLIGTVLGGVWAAQSWGRFWGWDPKENGALLIVLWALALMHAKRGGYIRHGGVAVGTVLLAMIVVFAWWGVNALGVGLHSYGFISGVWRTLTVFWLIESLIVLAGIIAVFARPIQALPTAP